MKNKSIYILKVNRTASDCCILCEAFTTDKKRRDRWNELYRHVNARGCRGDFFEIKLNVSPSHKIKQIGSVLDAMQL